jgi:hypothetical protein
MLAGVFAILPENFFSPLANVNREHYAALLVLYYWLFQENTRGLERELVVREFMNYLALHRDSLKEEDEEPARETAFNQNEPGVQELNFGADGEPDHLKADRNHAIDERILANKFYGDLYILVGLLTRSWQTLPKSLILPHGASRL